MSNLVALVETGRKNGRRTYTAFSKDGKPVHTVSVHDSGHGAASAIRSIVRAGFTISCAEWATKLANNISRKLDGQELLRVERDYHAG